MKKKLLFLVSSIALLVSCNSDSDEQVKTPPVFRYIFEIVDSIRLSNGNIMVSNATSSYVVELIHSGQDYLKECNILNYNDCIKVELSLYIVEGETLFYETVVKYTPREAVVVRSTFISTEALYDTIRYELSNGNNLITCKNIWVNGELYWRNQGNDVLPRVVLTAKQTEIVEPKPFVPIELTVKQGEKTRADNRFSFRMFREISTLNGSNTFFSPLSLNLALGMLYNGASGDTRNEMAEVLGMADFTENEINGYYQKMTQALQESDPLTGISIANSIWYRNDFSVKQPFIDINQTYFDAMVQALDFDKSDAVDIINNWCAEKTKDKIKGIIDDKISKVSMMYLINALYFKGKWESEFYKEVTKQAVFTKSDNREQKVNLMEQTGSFPYYADQHLQYVEKPYGNQAFSMAFILPAEGQGLEQLIEYLDDEVWQNIIDNRRGQLVHLKLPRFKVECKLLLNDAVENVGMKRIFSDGDGFANISDKKLVVSEILQKTFVAVDEKGSEAAAVTKIEMEVGSNGGNPNPPIPIPFFANRPFLYLIKEKSTGMILFIGRMDDPKE